MNRKPDFTPDMATEHRARQKTRSAALQPESLFAAYTRPRKHLVGMGCKARCVANSWLLASSATPQTAREGACPSGWGEIRRLRRPDPCMGMSPCSVPGQHTHPDCTPTRPRIGRKQALTPNPSQTARCPLRPWQETPGRYPSKQNAHLAPPSGRERPAHRQAPQGRPPHHVAPRH